MHPAFSYQISSSKLCLSSLVCLKVPQGTQRPIQGPSEEPTQRKSSCFGLNKAVAFPLNPGISSSLRLFRVQARECSLDYLPRKRDPLYSVFLPVGSQAIPGRARLKKEAGDSKLVGGGFNM